MGNGEEGGGDLQQVPSDANDGGVKNNERIALKSSANVYKNDIHHDARRFTGERNILAGQSPG